MLVIPRDSGNTFTIISIDPGSTCLGVAKLLVDVSTLKIVSSSAMTLHGDKMSKGDDWVKEIHGDRYSRVLALEKALLEIFNMYNPNFVIAESPFFLSRMPGAFQALTEVLCAIRNALSMHSQWLTLNLVSPSEAKQAIPGNKGNAKKDQMLISVCGLTDLNYNGEVPIELLDEHSIDALAIGYYLVKQLRS